GRRTLRRISAPLRASAALAAIFAPCASSRLSAKRDCAPAPACTRTVHPSPVSFLTVSGETATRGSPSRSPVTAIVTIDAPPQQLAGRTIRPVRARAAGGPVEAARSGHPAEQEQQHHHHEHDQDHGRAQKARVGAQVLGIVHGGMSARSVDGHCSTLESTRSAILVYRIPERPRQQAPTEQAPIEFALRPQGRNAAACAKSFSLAGSARFSFSLPGGHASIAGKSSNRPGDAQMDLGMTPKVKPLVEKVRAMVRDEIMPLEEEYEAEIGKAGNRFVYTERQTEILEGLKAKARERGLWNFWLTASDKGYGLTTVEYAYLAEELGWSRLAPETFNCSAPDTGNMEVLERYGSPAHKEQWLKPLLEGKIRSAYVMTEPGVASSDATNVVMEAKPNGDEWVLNGEKWFASGAGDPRCRIYIVMVCTDPDAPEKHKRHSQILVPAGTKGVEIVRPMHVYGSDDAPHGHMHLRFKDVRVPKDNLILGRGRGFEVSQGRLGPGRIHHCMRAIGQAERALELMCRRSLTREAFGKPLAQLGANYDIIAESRMKIEMARLLCLKAAYMMDTVGQRDASPYISQIKVIAPRIALEITDEAVQMHGAMGITQD